MPPPPCQIGLKLIYHFLSELRTRAKNYNFKDMQDSLIRNKVMFIIDDNALRNRSLGETENLMMNPRMGVKYMQGS